VQYSKVLLRQLQQNTDFKKGAMAGLIVQWKITGKSYAEQKSDYYSKTFPVQN